MSETFFLYPKERFFLNMAFKDHKSVVSLGFSRTSSFALMYCRTYTAFSYRKPKHFCLKAWGAQNGSKYLITNQRNQNTFLKPYWSTVHAYCNIAFIFPHAAWHHSPQAVRSKMSYSEKQWAFNGQKRTKEARLASLERAHKFSRIIGNVLVHINNSLTSE